MGESCRGPDTLHFRHRCPPRSEAQPDKLSRPKTDNSGSAKSVPSIYRFEKAKTSQTGVESESAFELIVDTKMEVESAAVRIVEVGPRDGLQNIRAYVPAPTKFELIDRLIAANVRTVELTSIVSPKAVPQLADHDQVLADPRIRSLIGRAGLRLPVLVPNSKGLQKALDHGVREIAVFLSATEGFSKANINCTVEQGLRRSVEVTKSARSRGIAVRG